MIWLGLFVLVVAVFVLLAVAEIGGAFEDSSARAERLQHSAAVEAHERLLAEMRGEGDGS